MITFDINGSIIKFDEKRDNYNCIRKDFKNYANEASETFKNYCLDNLGNGRRLNEKHLEYGESLINEVIRKGVETIVGYNIITIDYNLFKEIYCEKYLDFERLFNNVNRDLANNKVKKSNIKYFDIKPIISNLAEYVFDDCFNVHLAILDVLIENGVTEVNSYIDKKSIRQSNALFNNYRDGFINKLDGCKVIQKIIMSNPYRKEVYEYLIKEDGDFSCEIENLANYLGFDMKEYKSYLMDMYIKELMDKGVLNIEAAKEKVRKYAKYIGCHDENIFITRIDAIYTFENA
ncbi:kinase [Terrisporobacter sp.]